MRRCGDAQQKWLALDRRLLIALRALPHTPVSDGVARTISVVADDAQGWVLLGAAGAALDDRRRLRWLAATVTASTTEQASRQVKRVVRRPRPQIEGLAPLASVTARYSFASSHAATAAAAVYAFGGLLPRRGLVAWAMLTAASRPYLGVHYPSDVVGGALLGVAVGRTARALTKS